MLGSKPDGIFFLIPIIPRREKLFLWTVDWTRITHLNFQSETIHVLLSVGQLLLLTQCSFSSGTDETNKAPCICF